MRRINIILPILFLAIGVYILFSTYTTEKGNKELLVYSLISYNEYCYNKFNRYSITYYSTQVLENEEYYLCDDNNKITLNNISKSINKSVYDNNLIYIITIDFTLDSPITFTNGYLNVTNIYYDIKMDVGTFSIVEERSDYISYSYLNGHYSYINNNLVLVGISVMFDDDITINDTYINDNTFIQVNNIKETKDLPNIISNYEYNIFDKSKGSIKLKGKTRYYLPIGYDDFILLNRINLTINNKVMYIPSMRLTSLDINDYPGFLRSGEVVRIN